MQSGFSLWSVFEAEGQRPLQRMSRDSGVTAVGAQAGCETTTSDIECDAIDWARGCHAILIQDRLSADQSVDRFSAERTHVQ